MPARTGAAAAATVLPAMAVAITPVPSAAAAKPNPAAATPPELAAVLITDSAVSHPTSLRASPRLSGSLSASRCLHTEPAISTEAHAAFDRTPAILAFRRAFNRKRPALYLLFRIRTTRFSVRELMIVRVLAGIWPVVPLSLLHGIFRATVATACGVLIQTLVVPRGQIGMAGA
jgi:hypothetical protein